MLLPTRLAFHDISAVAGHCSAIEQDLATKTRNRERMPLTLLSATDAF